ncbi:7-methylguanosine phosphate-specific 5'-nucleotidase-like [Schistocerca gregaria]|uniref:7-methylguanosine phosphate-specific 5'-nucleotidase-like n=1 Tax=Schistocerca gregaria TaxID=7010 RepID=UPI00211DBF3F|nr:7-methylguanosine phosphate-specific 5'-nucleotidase-like [Schistocerca gregaria]
MRVPRKRKAPCQSRRCPTFSPLFERLTHPPFAVNGELVYGATTFSVFNDEAYFSRDFVKKTQEEYEKYVAYEFSDTLSHAEKVEYLEEWFASFFTRLTRENVSMEVLEKVASKAVVSFRQGTFHLLRLCQLFGVPFLVLSAGISQVIEKLLEVHAPSSSVTRGLEIGANHLVFDEGGRVQDFSKPVIHSLNKLESFREFVDASYRKHFDDFPPEEINVILLGDHIGDAHLASCFPREANVIKIGFLNHFEQSLLQTYKETFDVVAMNDGSMRVVIELLLEVFKAWPHV